MHTKNKKLLTFVFMMAHTAVTSNTVTKVPYSTAQMSPIVSRVIRA